MRKLVTIQQITDLFPIEGKDRIVLAQILGWTVIVKSDEFKVGDKCVFFEIDSFLPKDDRYSFLGKTINYDGNEGYRLRTMKMAGCLSQGLALPLRYFAEIHESLNIDTDVTNLLKVKKYDIDTVQSNNSSTLNAGKAEGTFPPFIPKTDQTRLQSVPSFVNIYKDAYFEETLKLDGSSMTCYKVIRTKPKTIWNRILKAFFGKSMISEHFGVCSRNLEIKKPDGDVKSDFWRAAIKYDIEKKLPVGYAIQGELIAPNIQANHEKVSSIEYYIFDVYDIKANKYLLPMERRQFCREHGFAHVPVISEDVQIFKDNSVQSILERVKGQSINPGTISEGRVYKHCSQVGISFKAISNDYLLKTGK